ncbi:hypothetical protein, partial [Dysosmobacter sp.]|uniref:hypothetical protein n=1 Tax=Dysosmobacter sp. TaxID=2591382 RepID=UPI002A8A4554
YDLILKLLENETKREALKRMSRYRREPLRVDSNACKKPAPAGVCAAPRQIFGQQSGQKIEVL